MTATATVPGSRNDHLNLGQLREGTPTSCPKWCNGRHTNGSAFTDQAPVHTSNLRVWSGDPTHGTPSYAVEFYRGDEWVDGELIIGQTDMTVTVTGGYAWEINSAGWCVQHGNLQAKDARRFARWLSRQAREIDPDHTNGKSPEDARAAALDRTSGIPRRARNTFVRGSSGPDGC